MRIHCRATLFLGLNGPFVVQDDPTDARNAESRSALGGATDARYMLPRKRPRRIEFQLGLHAAA
jgi:hypothetical protein